MRVAVVVDGPRVPAWHAWTIEALEAVSGAEVRVVDADTGAPAPRLQLARLAGPALAPVEISARFDPPGDVDLILDLAGTMVVGEPPLGVWSFRLGERNDAQLPFAHEYAGDAPTFEIELVRRVRGSYEQLRCGRFGAMPIYRNALRTALGHAARWPAIFAAALAARRPLATRPAGAPPRPAPLDGIAQARFLLGLTRRLGSAFAGDALDVTEWNVGFVESGPRALLDGEPLRVRWLEAPAPLTFIADPFVVRRDGKRVLFVEEFTYGRDRGVIEALTLDDEDRVVRRERVIDLPTHLSYPYPLEIDGELYLVPENCAGDEIALYRCVEFPSRWEREAPLLTAFDGVDTTIFAHEGRWWALCTRFSKGSTLALYAYHAPSPRGPWRAHALNPIVTDVACARPGGQPFVVDGSLYRPAQDCTRAYGDALAIMRIDRLTPDEFGETFVRRIDARELAPYDCGIHTLSFDGERMVIDGKRVFRDARKLPWALRHVRSRIARLVTRNTVTARSPALTRR